MMIGQMNILINRLGKQKRLLQNDLHMTAQPRFGNIAQLHTVDGNTATVIVIDTAQQMHQTGFPAPRRSHDGDALSLMDGKGQIVQRMPASILITKADLIEADITTDIRPQSAFQILCLLLQHLLDSRDGNADLAKIGQNPSKLTQRPYNGTLIHQKHKECTDTQLSLQRHADTENNHEQNLHLSQKIRAAPKQCQGMHQIEIFFAVCIICLLKFINFMLFLMKCLYDAHGIQIFLQHGGHGAFRQIAFQKNLLRLGKKHIAGNQNQRNQGNGYQRQLHTATVQNQRCQCDIQNRKQHLRKLVGQKSAHRFDIRGASLNQITAIPAFMIGKRQLL